MNQAPKNTTEDRFAPEHVHQITFGSPPRNSVPVNLVSDDEWKSLVSAEGKYEGLKRTIEMTNGEIYRYLKLGVSTQSASCLKWMGYETPEVLLESESVSALLPDHLGRSGNAYPMRFIEQCEAEGVSALVCQMALRRGITERHLEGPLTLNEILYAFTNIVKKNVVPAAGSDTQPSVINYICDGTLPFHLVKDVKASTPSILIIVRDIFLAEPESDLAVKLRSDAEMFGNCARVLGSSSLSDNLGKLKKVIDEHGYDVLRLVNPMLCFHKIGEGENKRPLGYEATVYTEKFLQESKAQWNLSQLMYGGFNQHVSASSTASPYHSVAVPFTDLDELCRAGIDTSVAYQYIVDEGMTPGALIAAQQDEVETALMSGAL